MSSVAHGANHESLAASKTWRALLHVPVGTRQSEIETAAFFLAENGATQPLAELQATVSTFAQQPEQMCRYPARAAWLQQKGVISNFDPQQCTVLQKWLNGQAADQVSVIFADGFLDNPASFYGHMLIRVGDRTADDTQKLLANSFNFGARVPDDENPVVYITKGLFGGYQAAFSTSHYYRYDINYAEAELRDLWSYDLATNAQQSQLLIWHLWELLETDYTYFFSSRNCAYHMARALELVTDQTLVARGDPFVLPADIIKRLSMATIDGQPAVQKRRLQPSRLHRFQQKWQQLQDAEQALAVAWLQSPQPATLATTESTSQLRVIAALTDFYAYRLSQEHNDPELKQRLEAEKTTLLRARMLMPMGNNPQWQQREGSAPETGQEPSMLRVGWQQSDLNDSHENALTLSFRPAYYDVLQRQQGRLENATLTMAEMGVSLTEQELKLEHAWLLRLHTLNYSATGMPGDGGASWGLNLGWQRDRLRQTVDDLSPQLLGSYGKAFKAGDAHWFDAALRAELRDPSVELGAVVLSPQLTWLADWSGARSQCRTRYEWDTAQRLDKQWFIGCEIAFHLGKNQDFRLSLAHQNASTLALSWSWYW
ncbi:Lnb N-terminal periplasmic domain-containing protein [Pseudidiomarina salilacus]|uniref:Lnb N-terminal periplasmic domain-containing protein n=1 Tax=Pseudidiomarina salilacus TaxID=3384452 RepID=UPI0039847C00